MNEPTMRLRGGFTTTTKGVFTVDVTCEITGIELSVNNMETAQTLLKENLSQLHDKVKEVALSKGYTECVVDEKK